MEARKGNKCVALPSLNLSDRLGWVVNATPLLLYRFERAPRTNLTGGLVGNRTGLN